MSCAATSTGPVLPRVGDQGPLPRRPQQPGHVGAGAQAPRRREPHARPHRARALSTARGVVGIFPANGVGDDVEVYADEARSSVLTTLHGLRQQGQHRDGVANKCLSDFVAPGRPASPTTWEPSQSPRASGSRSTSAFKDDLDDYSAIMLEALADRLAEAFAERLHEKVRRELWGYAPTSTCRCRTSSGKYAGIRPAPGYPACPVHREGDAHGAPRRRGAHRHPAHGVDGDVAGRLGVGLVLRPPRASTSSSGASVGPGRVVAAARKGWTCAPPSGGWPRTSATSRRTDRSAVPGTGVSAAAAYGEPMTPALSPSRAADFKQCPLLFRFRTIDKLEGRPPRGRRGALVHAVLEHLFDLPAASARPRRRRRACSSRGGPRWSTSGPSSGDDRRRRGAHRGEGYFAGAHARRAVVRPRGPHRLEPAARSSTSRPRSRASPCAGTSTASTSRRTGPCGSSTTRRAGRRARLFEAKALFQMKFCTGPVAHPRRDPRPAPARLPRQRRGRPLRPRRARPAGGRAQRPRHLGGRRARRADRRLAPAHVPAVRLVRLPRPLPGVGGTPPRCPRAPRDRARPGQLRRRRPRRRLRPPGPFGEVGEPAG